MKARIEALLAHPSLSVRSRVKRILRVRYGYAFSATQQRKDPVWLSAHGM